MADHDLFPARAAAAPSLPPVACPFGRIHCRRRGARRRHLRCGLNIRRGLLLLLRRRREQGKQVERVGGGGGAPRWRLDSAVSSVSAGRRGAPRRGGSGGVDGGGALGVRHLLSLSSLPSIRAKAWWLGAGTAGGAIPFVPSDSGFGVGAVERNGPGRFTVARCREINAKSELQFALRSRSSLRCGQP
jgi:hypothetical protein